MEIFTGSYWIVVELYMYIGEHGAHPELSLLFIAIVVSLPTTDGSAGLLT